MEPALQVDFEIIVEVDQTSEPANASNASNASSTRLDAMIDALETMKANPVKILERVSSRMSARGRNFTIPLEARLATPTISRANVRLVADAWGACGGNVQCTFNATVWRFREVWCAADQNLSFAVPLHRCRTSQPMASVEQCTMRPPECGWHVGNWSLCRSESSTDQSGQSLCNSSGQGVQLREVYCRSESGPEFTWPGTAVCENREQRPQEKRSCYCGVSLASASLSGHDLLPEAPLPLPSQTSSASAGIAPELVIVVGVGGLLVACGFCCFISGKTSNAGQKVKVKPETLPAEARMDVADAEKTPDRKSRISVGVPESPAAGASPLGAWVSSKTSSSRSSVSQSPASSPTKVLARQNSGTPVRRVSVDSNDSEPSAAANPLRRVGKARPRPAPLGSNPTQSSTRRTLPADRAAGGVTWRTQSVRKEPKAQAQAWQAAPPAQQRSTSAGSSSRASLRQAASSSSSRAPVGPRTPQDEQSRLTLYAPQPKAQLPEMPLDN